MPDATLHIAEGQVLALFVFDVGLAIDIDAAQAALARGVLGATEVGREQIKHPIGTRRTPEYFEFRAAPLRIDMQSPPIAVGPARTSSLVECTLYDFGAVTIVYRIDIAGDAAALLPLADELYENVDLLTDARAHVERLCSLIGAAVSRPTLARVVEDYVIYHVRRATLDHGGPPGGGWDQWPPAVRATLARVLRAEPLPLSAEEEADALASVVRYGESDAVVVDWNAAIIFQDHAEDVISVLEFANVELLELRFLDDRLDEMLDRSYERVVRRPETGRLRLLPGADREEARRLAALQMDSALLFENVNNALKLLGDQYLARVYQVAARRFHLPEWDSAILRKISTVRDLYDKLNDERATRRMEFLEWIIIILIAVSIVIPFLPGIGK